METHSQLNLFDFSEMIERRLKPAVAAVLNSLESPKSQELYRLAFRFFFRWHSSAHPGEMLSRDTVLEYGQHMKEPRQRAPLGLAQNTRHTRLSAIRRMSMEAARLKIITFEVAAEICTVKVRKRKNRKDRQRLSESQCQLLIAGFGEASAAKGAAGGGLTGARRLADLRDRALLGVLIGCGIRRDECRRLSVEHLGEIDGRPAIISLVGKGEKPRSIGMKADVRQMVGEWIEAAQITSGQIFRSVDSHGRVGDPLTAPGLGWIVSKITTARGMPRMPHDLRHTNARLAADAGCPLEQNQYNLGHSSPETTEDYIGRNQNFHRAPCDYINLTPDPPSDTGASGLTAPIPTDPALAGPKSSGREGAVPARKPPARVEANPKPKAKKAGA